MAISYAFRRAVEQAVARFFTGSTGHRHDGTDGQGPLLATWQPWTPTVTQGVSVACTVTEARYCLIGKVCHIYARLVITGAGAANDNIKLSGLPAAAQCAAGATNKLAVGTAYYTYGAGSVERVAVALSISADDIRLWDTGSQGWAGISPAFGLVANNVINLSATYRVA